jgi:DhnA family fructose-bisphosphate aldolase class Ia
MEHGAAGIAFGRNVFDAEAPRKVVEDLVEAVHGVG